MSVTKNAEILSVEKVSKSFPGVKALDKVSFSIKKGTVHGLVGENGAGKSTLMKILSGVYTKDEGTVVFDGEEIKSTTPIKSMNSGLAIIYQELNLVNTLSVGENIFIGRFTKMGGMRGVHKKSRELLDSISCKIDTYKLVEDLSVSEKQMVEIAKALSFESKLIIMDEPSSSLTCDEMKELVAIIRQLKERGISIIYISHKLDEIFDFCDIVTIMRDGKVIDTKPVENLTRSDMIAKMVGRTIENEYPARASKVGKTLLEVKNINTRKLHDISFEVKSGEILGFVGLVGAGRSEIIRAIYGADKAKGHKVLLDGKEIKIKKPADAIKAGIGLIPEDRKQEGLVLPFSVEQNISMASFDKITKRGIIRKSLERAIAEKHVRSLSIKTPSIKTKVLSLSGGNQQKCIIGRWLEIDPKVFIMDEPTRGIDVGAKYEIYLLMQAIAEQGGAVILISSELPEVLNMSNRVLTIFEGRITGEFDPEIITAEQVMEGALGICGGVGAL